MHVVSFNTLCALFVSAMTPHRPTVSSHLAGLLVPILLSVAAVTDGAWGQDRATARVEENIRAEPQGVIIGRLLAGASLPVVRTDGRWVQVEVEGWIWTRSIQVTDRQGFDLSVSVGPDENLRFEPAGEVVARLLEGALLDRVEDGEGWTRVRRVAWVWGPSMDIQEGNVPVEPQAEPPQPSHQVVSWWRAGPGGAPILSGPDGDTVAVGRPGTELQVLARQGNWTRIRLDGWVWAPEGMPPDSLDRAPRSEISPQEVAEDPDAFRGFVVEWELQFVSMERAERVRTDFYEGEPFLLTRVTSPGRSFVYVAVPPERLGEVEGLIPLERIRVVGRIRTGAAVLTGNPILDLMELTRLPRE